MEEKWRKQTRVRRKNNRRIEGCGRGSVFTTAAGNIHETLLICFLHRSQSEETHMQGSNSRWHIGVRNNVMRQCFSWIL